MDAKVGGMTGRIESADRNRQHMLDRIAEVRELEERTRARSARAAAQFHALGKLLPRERLAHLLDADQPFYELMTLAGYWSLEDPDPATSIPGSALIVGIGHVSGVRCMVAVNDSGISAGAMQSYTGQKLIRAQEIALAQKLPLVQLIESAGGNLRKYRVERFMVGGGMFYNLARLSAAGLPVVSLIHGSSAAGGAYLPGLSDYVVMVREQAHAYLAGPSLLKAATGEDASDEELGGADMHACVSGLADYVADNDLDGIERVRAIMRQIDWQAGRAPPFAQPLGSADDLLQIMPVDSRTPVDMREVIARLVDGSEFHAFKEQFGAPTVCGYAHIEGHAVGILTNNGPLDSDGANKAAQFIQLCVQLGRPLVFLQNITGFMVGTAHEQAGMIKHGAKLIQALSNASVTRLTVMCGASYGAGNYGMCGRAFKPDLLLSWPNSKTAVMGGEQAAMTMRLVAEASARRSGKPLDEAQAQEESAAIVRTFESQSGAIHTSSMLLDDGVIDPRETRSWLGMALATAAQARQRQLAPVQFGVARF
ncbi:acyl-CoA carboxylase subunit beta [Diaphorobacter aerolatus]|uniref:Acyl-CoA carboxylase subunit beta n=1 Tax=Diaphorobacter aerolatus TaxID=1288495 RepID=A0A7H0GM56_9BURK|nr:carboxyl transferase domain-containing protein [Diaphorobacter aerolatus]QNP49372.1 acyl-CoA carboxylase subunit beta [Diaphorobacter aerolatus]